MGGWNAFGLDDVPAIYLIFTIILWAEPQDSIKKRFIHRI